MTAVVQTLFSYMMPKQAISLANVDQDILCHMEFSLSGAPFTNLD